jgi:diguanylate cyclase (GGDEF)-like protein
MAVLRNPPNRGSVLGRLEAKRAQSAPKSDSHDEPPPDPPMAADTGTAAALPERAAPADGPGPSGRPSVLVADRLAAVAELLTDTLGADYDITLVGGGEALLDAAFAHRPDLVLLAAELAPTDGFAICRQLKSDPRTRDIPVVFLGSDHSAEVEEIHALECGAIDFLAAPLRPTALVLRVANHLASKRQRDDLVNQSLVDAVTGVANRRQFELTLEKEWRRAARLGIHLSLVLVDLAPMAGGALDDASLRELARLLYGTLQRPADSLARYGARRFAFILPQTDEDGLALMLARTRDRLADWNATHADAALAMALGGATDSPTHDMDAVSLLRRVDAATSGTGAP